MERKNISVLNSMNNEALIDIVFDLEKLPQIIKSGKYEMAIKEVIEKSLFFTGKKLTYNASQSHGESDFIDNFGEKYEVKMALETSHGELIGNVEDVDISSVKSYVSECIKHANSEHDFSSNLSAIRKDGFYQTVRRLCKKIKSDETPIIYIPFPIVLAIPQQKDILFCDYLHYVFTSLNIEYKHGDIDPNCDRADYKHFYFVYPSLNNQMVIRDMPMDKWDWVEDKMLPIHPCEHIYH